MTTANLQLQPQFSIIDLKLRAEQLYALLDISENTRIDYAYRIGLFLNFIKKQGFNNNSFLDFKRYLKDRTELTVSTKNKYLAASRVFLKELNRQGVIPADVTQNIKSFTQDKKHKKLGLNEAEIGLLTGKLSQLPDTPQNARLRVIVALLTLQGLRQIEIVRLDVADIDLAAKRALILGKGKDDKEPVDLHPQTVEALEKYLVTNKIKSGPLFQSLSNNNRNQRFTTRALRQIVKEVLTGLGIDKSVHGFRHYFTSTLIRAYKGDLLEVAQYTRHRSLEMLQVYNDAIKKKADLPRFYKAFNNLNFS